MQRSLFATSSANFILGCATALLLVATVLGAGYAEYESYDNKECSGTPTRGARAAGDFCIEDDKTSNRISCAANSTTEEQWAVFKGYGSNGCTGTPITTYVGPSSCVKLGNAWIRGKSCSDTGDVPVLSGPGLCSTQHTGSSCSGPVVLSNCAPIKPCDKVSDGISGKADCSAERFIVYQSSDCSGDPTPNASISIADGTCLDNGKLKISSCTSPAIMLATSVSIAVAILVSAIL